MRFSMTVTGILAAASAASAATPEPQSCSELRAAYRQDAMSEGKYSCARADRACNRRQEAQLRATVLSYEAATEAELRAMSRSQLWEQFDPIFSTIGVGERAYEVANIDLGDNSFQLLFFAGTTVFSGIGIADGSVQVQDKYCEVEFEPYTSKARLTNLCRGIVSKVEAARPDSRFNVDVCTSRRPVDSETGNVTQVIVESHTKTRIEYFVSRNLHDMGAGYFSCKATVDRRSDRVLRLSCEVK